MRSITEQLRAAFEKSGMTVVALLEKSRLDIDRTSLAKKLKGEIRLNTDEAQVLATILDVTIVWSPEMLPSTKAEGAA